LALKVRVLFRQSDWLRMLAHIYVYVMPATVVLFRLAKNACTYTYTDYICLHIYILFRLAENACAHIHTQITYAKTLERWLIRLAILCSEQNLQTS
jgi:hypothetical protein